MMSRGGFGTRHDGWLTAARRAVLLAAAGALLLVASPLSLAAPDDDGKVSPEVAARARGARAGDLIPVIVQTSGDPSDAHLVRLHGLGGVLKVRHDAVRGYSASLPAGALGALAMDQEVARVSLDAPVHAFLDVAVRAVRADVAAALRPGIDGRGVGIALIDTGVALHPDLQRSPGPAAPFEVDFVGRDHAMADPFGHGTHVAGILNGNGLLSAGPGAYRTFRGIAPGARLISLRALQPDGTGTTSDVIAAIDWVMRHRRAYDIRVLNLSLGHPVYESYRTDPLCRAARAAVEAGIVVIAAAGNDGRIGSGFGTIVSPGNEPAVITVGAMDDNDTAAREDDVLAPYSAKGPTLVDHVLKPDLVAPGTFIVSARAAGSRIDTEHHEAVLRAADYLSGAAPGRDGDYLLLSGTSLAAPMVAGAAALLLQQDPSLRPSDVKARLMTSASHDGGLPFAVGAGYLDVEAALASQVRAESALSPRAVAVAGGAVILIPLEGSWNGGWDLGLIWGGGRQVGTVSDTENDMVTASGLVWGGGSSYVNPEGLVWGGGSSYVAAEGLVWGGGASIIGTEGSDLACTGLVWGGGN